MSVWRSGAVCRIAGQTYDLEPQGGAAGQEKSESACSAPTGKCSSAKKPLFGFMEEGYLTRGARHCSWTRRKAKPTVVGRQAYVRLAKRRRLPHSRTDI
ncbi:hypothetical protein [Bacillus thermotolerans]|uniref:hypothetical protein n=1 Tax=Bacillus thermotolerans TaxID=1221996 RepID=UPI00058943FC|nr:hypothetical protein [Bacillus thermotolerans]